MQYTEKTMETTKQQKRLFKMYIKTKLDVAQDVWHNLAAMRKSKAALTLNKPAYIEMCILELSKVLLY